MGVSAQGIDPLNKGKKNAYRASKEREDLANMYGSPEYYMDLVKKLQPFYEQQLAPGRARSADAVSLGANSQSRQYAGDLARLGLTGSGADVYGQQSIRGGRNANMNDLNVRFWEEALRQAITSGGEQQRTQLGALLGTEIPKRPSGATWLNPAGVDSASFSMAGM